MAVAVFDYARWIARYPEFTAVQEATADEYFAEAELSLDNTDSSIVCDVDKRLILLNMLTAHVASLSGALNGGVPTGLVGRISDATEGTVKVAVSMTDSANSAYFMQTPYGAAFWNATRVYRTARYYPGPAANFDPVGIRYRRWPI